MTNRSNFLLDLERFHACGIVEVVGVIHNTRDRVNPFPQDGQIPGKIKLPPGVLLSSPKLQFTPHLERLRRVCPLKILSYTVCLYKLYQTVKKIYLEANNPSSKSDACDISRLATWKLIAQSVLLSSKDPSSKKIQFPPSLLNKLKQIFQTFVEPYDKAVQDALDEARRKNALQRMSPHDLNQSFPNDRIPALHDENSRDSFAGYGSPATPGGGTSRSGRGTSSRFIAYYDDEADEETDETGIGFKEREKDKSFAYRPWRPRKSRNTNDNKPARWNRDQLLGNAEEEKERKTTGTARSSTGGPFRPQIVRTPPEYSHMLCSLESGLANERDFALNAAAMLTSSAAQSIPMTQLYSCKLNLMHMYDKGSRLLGSLLRHGGVNPEYVADADELMSFWSLLVPSTVFNELHLDKDASCSTISNTSAILINKPKLKKSLDLASINAPTQPPQSSPDTPNKPPITSSETPTATTPAPETPSKAADPKSTPEKAQPAEVPKFTGQCLLAPHCLTPDEVASTEAISVKKYESILLRITTIAEIIRNLTFSLPNCEICWANDDVQRFVLLLVNSTLPDERTVALQAKRATKEFSRLDQSTVCMARTRSSLMLIGLDILSNVSQIVKLESLNLHTRAMFLEMCSKFPDRISFLGDQNLHNSRDVYLRSIQIFANLSRTSENRALLESHTAVPQLAALLAQCTISDVESILYTLEVFLALSELSEKFCKMISMTKGAIKLFIDLLSLNIRNQPQRVLSAVILRQPTIRHQQAPKRPLPSQPFAQRNPPPGQPGSEQGVHPRGPVPVVPMAKVDDRKTSGAMFPKATDIFFPPEAPRAKFHWPPQKRARTESPNPPSPQPKKPEQPPTGNRNASKQSSSASQIAPKKDAQKSAAPKSHKPHTNGPMPSKSQAGPANHLHMNGHARVPNGDVHPSSDEDHGLNSDFSDSNFDENSRSGFKSKLAKASVNGGTIGEMKAEVAKLNGHKLNGSAQSSTSSSTITNGGPHIFLSEDDDSKHSTHMPIIPHNSFPQKPQPVRPDSVANSACSGGTEHPDLESNQSLSPQPTLQQASTRLADEMMHRGEARHSSEDSTAADAANTRLPTSNRQTPTDNCPIEHQKQNQRSPGKKDGSPKRSPKSPSRPERLPTPPELFQEPNLQPKSALQVMMVRQNKPLVITDFTDCVERQDAISKHIQLTAAIILTNIVSSSDQYSKRVVRQYRQLLARIAFSRMDCAIQVARCLFEIDGSETSKSQAITEELNNSCQD